MSNYKAIVCMYTRGYFHCHVIADNEDEAIEIADKLWEEADFGELKEAEIISASVYLDNDREYSCSIYTQGYYETEVEFKENTPINDILMQAENEGWSEADFGEIDDADVILSEIIDEWEV